MLSIFLSELFKSGEVTVAGELIAFTDKDKQEALQLLSSLYETSLLEMPVDPPVLDETAALWSAEALYRIIQFITIRTLDTERLDANWIRFTGESSPAAIASVDLCLRYLPDVLNLAVKLAPDDPLIIKIKSIACAWPYSSVGIALNELPDETGISKNKALWMNYIDRIIEKKDLARLKNPHLKEAIEVVLGNYSEHIWPGYELINN